MSVYRDKDIKEVGFRKETDGIFQDFYITKDISGRHYLIQYSEISKDSTTNSSIKITESQLLELLKAIESLVSEPSGVFCA